MTKYEEFTLILLYYFYSEQLIINMGIKRLKKYRRFINFFKVVYKFKPPFKILLDGNFFHMAV